MVPSSVPCTLSTNSMIFAVSSLACAPSGRRNSYSTGSSSRWYAEGLQHREGDGHDRHDRKQRRVDEAHGTQPEIAAGEIAQQRVEVTQWRGDQAQRPAAERLGQVEQPVLDAQVQGGKDVGWACQGGASLARPTR